jgi:tetratricopeptide (TPR) repeat protein
MKKVLLMIALCACAAPAGAESPGRLVSKGNKQYDKKDFAKAIELYDRASVKAPESAIVAFNKGDAFFKKGDLEKAREQFQQAASKTKDLSFESKAWYNLGNCAFEEGKRQEDSDLQKALESLQQSVKHYGTALVKDPGN